MKIISCIADHQLIGQIFEHHSLWLQKSSRDLPSQEAFDQMAIVYEPCGIAPHRFVDSTG